MTFDTDTATATDAYLADRLREIFASVPPRPPHTPHTPAHTHTHHADSRWPYFVGATARQALIEAAGGPRRISAYLTALATANPTPQHWYDTRPQQLRDTDRARLTAPKPLLPMWTEGYDRREGGRLCLVLAPATVTAYATIARHWGIAPQSYITRTTYRPMERLRTTPIATFHTVPPHALTTAVLRAIAVGYLTPSIPLTPKGGPADNV